MSDESKNVDSSPSTVVEPSKEVSNPSTPKKSGSKVWIIVLVVVLALCCLASLVGGGIWTLGYLGSQASKATVDSLGQTNESWDNQPDNTVDSNDLGGENSDGTNDSGIDSLEDFFSMGSDFVVRVDDVNQNGDDVEISLSIKNNSGSTQTFSTLLYLSLVSDTNADGYIQDFLSPLYQQDGAQLDGEIAAGATDRGVVVYKVTDNPRSLTLKVSQGLFSGEYVSIPIM